ncbi:hypothetical protein MKW98_030181 [Papaver atlanticum]|uniref:Uncharacterized protein n=1 Tax=Papaver atlanticum TaxID=357466 RepID=A0AAD4SRF8_9MAGN|nr:hypothetical protein MKW98_030181 [Papaver atlanticum]
MAFKVNLTVLLFTCFLILAAEVQFNQAVERHFKDSPRYKECYESCIQDTKARVKERSQGEPSASYLRLRCENECKIDDEYPPFPRH